MGADLAVQKEPLRHADIKTTMNVYIQAATPAKRKAIRKPTQKLLKDRSRTNWYSPEAVISAKLLKTWYALRDSNSRPVAS